MVNDHSRETCRMVSKVVLELTMSGFDFVPNICANIDKSFIENFEPVIIISILETWPFLVPLKVL